MIVDPKSSLGGDYSVSLELSFSLSLSPLSAPTPRRPKKHQKHYQLSRFMRKPDICVFENKSADQLCSNCTADQRLCFHYTNSKIPFLRKSEISSF